MESMLDEEGESFVCITDIINAEGDKVFFDVPNFHKIQNFVQGLREFLLLQNQPKLFGLDLKLDVEKGTYEVDLKYEYENLHKKYYPDSFK